jgi:hypothetical protein
MYTAQKIYNFYSDTNRIIQQRRAAAQRITAASSSGTRQAKVKASNIMSRPCSVLSKVNVTLTWLWWPHYQLHSSPTQTVKHHHLHILQTRCINETLSLAYTAIIIMLICFHLQYLVANLQHTTMNIALTHASPASQCY